ncbi:hypothetical protein ALC62_14805, partial [Cyphomyrmex costatus]
FLYLFVINFLIFYKQVLGAICIGISSNNVNSTIFSFQKQYFFLIASSSFFIGTSILFLSYLVSPLTTSILPKTILEPLYNILAFNILFVASISLLLEIHRRTVYNYEALLAVSVSIIQCL